MNTEKIIGFSELKKWLRHRHPMIFIDRIIDYEPKEYLKAIMNISGTMDCIAGHFPNRAIFPASHLMQAFAQTGIILYQMSTSMLEEDEFTVIGSIKSRFYKPVYPGDQVIIQTTCEKIIGLHFFFSTKAYVSDSLVCVFKGTIARVKEEGTTPKLW